jgi:hypothetical protein
MSSEGSNLQLCDGKKARSVALGGLVRRRTCWIPTAIGWLACFAFFVASAFFGILHIYPFLAVTEPVEAEVLVVEGLVNDAGLKEALKESQRHSYRKILTTGGPIEEGSRLARYGTTAQVAALSLQALGAKADVIQPVPANRVRRNRTYQAGAALRSYLDRQTTRVNAINVFTGAAHARRTRLLYQRALGPEVKVGIIACQGPYYDPKRWWLSGEGVQNVLAEAFAYCYARLTLWTLR